jgi:hypothetical protein
MTATVLRRPAPQRSFAWDFLQALVAAVGEVYNRNAKRSPLSWHYFAA